MSAQQQEKVDADILPEPKKVNMKSPWVAVGTAERKVLHNFAGDCSTVHLQIGHDIWLSRSGTLMFGFRRLGTVEPVYQNDLQLLLRAHAAAVYGGVTVFVRTGGGATIGALCMMIYASKKVRRNACSSCTQSHSAPMSMGNT